MNKLREILYAAAGILLLTPSCQRLEFSGNGGSRAIMPRVSSVASSKADGISGNGALIATYTISDDSENPLYLQVFENRLDEGTAYSRGTKGQIIVSDGSSEGKSIQFNGSRFMVHGYLETAIGSSSEDNHAEAEDRNDYHFIKGRNVQYSSSTSTWSWGGDSPAPVWRNDVNHTFWSFYPYEFWYSCIDLTLPGNGGDKPSDAQQAKVSFSYTLPDPDAFIEDAHNQNDLLVAYNCEKRIINDEGTVTAFTGTASTADKNDINIHFYHALSAIKFINNVSSGVQISTIGLGKVRSGGDCDVTISGGKPVFTWKNYGDRKTYNEFFESGDFGADGKQDPESEKFFFMIPQPLDDADDGNDVTLDLVFEISGHGSDEDAKLVTKSVNISKDDASNPLTWEPGKYYTYKLTKNNSAEYSFKVTDLSDNPVSELTFNNTTAPGWKQIKILESDKIGEKALTYTAEYSTDGGLTWTPYDYSSVKISGFEASANPGVLNGTDNPIFIDLIADPRIKTSEMYRWKDRVGEPDMTGSESAPIDLSKMPVGGEGNGTSPMNTANTYIVKHPGYYKFPCVYGNAIKDGATSTSGYITSVTGSNVLSNFLNASGTGISDPYVVTDLGLSPSSVKASLVWCDFIYGKDLLVQNVELSPDGRYISFNTLQRDDLVEGNALIALYTDNNSNGKYDEGEALWSWQIWISDSNLADYNVGKVGSEGGAFGHYYFMSSTLGYCYDIPSVGMTQVADEFKEFKLRLIQEESGLTHIIDIRQPDTEDYGIPQNAPYYEWGRKDPFVAGYKLNNGYSGLITDKAFYDAERNSLSVATAGQDLYPNDNASSTISNSIKNPGTFCTQSSFDNTFNNLWITDNNSTLNFSKQPLKTVYDPSPYGYVIPNSEAFGNFANGDAVGTTPYPINGEWNNTLYGCLINNSDGVKDDNLFVPALCRRNWKDGKLEYSTTCYYWSSIQNDSNKMGLAFWDYYHNDVITAGPFSRSYGFSVRPILEGTAAVPPAVISADPNDWRDGSGNIGF